MYKCIYNITWLKITLKKGGIAMFPTNFKDTVLNFIMLASLCDQRDELKPVFSKQY